MPINKKEGETKDEFISRCIKDEMYSGKDQDQAVAICIAKADELFTTMKKHEKIKMILYGNNK